MLSAKLVQQCAAAPARRRVVKCQSTADAVPQPQKAASRPALIGNRRAMLLGGLAGAMCSCCAPQPAAASNWGYDCPGPDAWEGVCRTSVSQSPIDIPISTLEQSIRFNYPEIIRANVINNGHGSPQVNIPEEASCLVNIEGETYRLIQYHFHAPSEHTFNGKHTLMEVHLVHKNIRTGELAVLGVTIQAGAEKANPCLDTALLSAPLQAGIEVPMKAAIPIRALLPKPRVRDVADSVGVRPYATYDGSLTTPPCTEGVFWIVFLDPIQVQASQVLDFLTFARKDGKLNYNSRPTQPLGNRQLRYFV